MAKAILKMNAETYKHIHGRNAYAKIKSPNNFKVYREEKGR